MQCAYRVCFLVKLLESCVELVISSLLREKVVVVSALDYFALFKDHNGVRVSDGGETVSYDEGGSILHKSIHTVLYMALGSGVDRGSSLIEN